MEGQKTQQSLVAQLSFFGQDKSGQIRVLSTPKRIRRMSTAQAHGAPLPTQTTFFGPLLDWDKYKAFFNALP